MLLSDLQKYIVTQVYARGPKCGRSVFESFYKNAGEQENKIITVSLERLITKGFIKAYGYKTAEKFFIREVSLTPRGRRRAHQLREDAERLPFARRRHAKKQKK